MECARCGAAEAGAGHVCAADAPLPGETQIVRDRRPSVSRPSMAPGAVLGSYRLISPIGEGAVGKVFLAEHVKLGRRVALKVLRSEFSDNLKAVTRFFGEAQAVNRIAHENIVAITDFVERNDHHPSFFIMELLEGQTLLDALVTQNVLAPPIAMAIAIQLASALEAAHQQQIVHRDIKPANIFLVPRSMGPPFVKLLDFGVAKLSAETKEPNTNVGDLIGTPLYMPPEQAYGLEVDARADVYALGAVLHEMLFSRPPFIAPTIREIISMVRNDPVVLPSKAERPQPVPPALEALILACLAKHPAERPQTAHELEQKLRAIATPVRRPFMYAAAAAVLLMVGVIGYAATLDLDPKPVEVVPERPIAQAPEPKIAPAAPPPAEPPPPPAAAPLAKPAVARPVAKRKTPPAEPIGENVTINPFRKK